MRVVHVVLCGVFLVAGPSGRAQEAHPAASGGAAVEEQAVTSDPAELMRLSGALNRITYPGAQPWHLKAEYEVLDSDGHKTDRGVYEAFWAGPKKLKQSYASKTFSQTNYMTETGFVRVGEMRGASGPERVVATRVFARLPSDDTLARTSQQLYPQTIEGKQYRCVALNRKQPIGASATVILPSYCLDLDRLALRYERGTGATASEVSGTTSLNEITVFHGHFVARDIRVSHFDKPYLHIHIDVLEDIAQVNEADFQPPPQAAPAAAPRPVVSEAEMRGRLTYEVKAGEMTTFMAEYDQRVVLSILVGKDGTVTSVRPIEGWKALQTLAWKAVAQRIYRPYLVNGQPVEVETEVVEHFKATKNP